MVWLKTRYPVSCKFVTKKLVLFAVMQAKFTILALASGLQDWFRWTTTRGQWCLWIYCFCWIVQLTGELGYFKNWRQAMYNGIAKRVATQNNCKSNRWSRAAVFISSRCWNSSKLWFPKKSTKTLTDQVLMNVTLYLPWAIGNRYSIWNLGMLNAQWSTLVSVGWCGDVIWIVSVAPCCDWYLNRMGLRRRRSSATVVGNQPTWSGLEADTVLLPWFKLFWEVTKPSEHTSRCIIGRRLLVNVRARRFNPWRCRSAAILDKVDPVESGGVQTLNNQNWLHGWQTLKGKTGGLHYQVYMLLLTNTLTRKIASTQSTSVTLLQTSTRHLRDHLRTCGVHLHSLRQWVLPFLVVSLLKGNPDHSSRHHGWWSLQHQIITKRSFDLPVINVVFSNGKYYAFIKDKYEDTNKR